MSYTINLTDGTIFAVVQDGTINTNSSVTLVGKNYAGYGEFMDENFIQMLENYSNSVPPTAPLTGQLWPLPFLRARYGVSMKGNRHFGQVIPIYMSKLRLWPLSQIGRNYLFRLKSNESKYAMVFLRPSSSWTFGSQPRSCFALEISGCRWRGSSSGRGL